MTAAAIRGRRDHAEMKAAESGKKKPRATELDVWPIVVENEIRNTPDNPTAAKQLMAWVKTKGTKEMQEFLFKIRGKLSALIDDIWRWEHVERDVFVAKQSRLDALRSAAVAPCVSQRRWVHHVAESFRLNGIDAVELCQDIYNTCAVGRSEQVPVIVLAGAKGGEGKSFFLKPLNTIFGEDGVFGTPEAGAFPMTSILGKKVAFLDEFGFSEDIVSHAA